MTRGAKAWVWILTKGRAKQSSLGQGATTEEPFSGDTLSPVSQAVLWGSGGGGAAEMG